MVKCNKKHAYKIQILLNFIENVDLVKLNELVENQYIDNGILYLQDYIGDHLRQEYLWVTSIGVIDAMEGIVQDAVENGNIKDQYSEIEFNQKFCGKCSYLTLIEEEQTGSKRNEVHFCKLFKKKVFHFNYHPYLPRLDECKIIRTC